MEIRPSTTPPAEEVAAPPADRLVPGVAGSLSPSRAAEFRACPLRYRFRVVDRLPQQPSPAATRGTVVHRVLERVFDLPAAQRTPDNALALVEEAWDEALADEPGLSVMFGADEPFEPWLASCRTAVQRYFALEDPRRLDPARREEAVEALLDSGLVLRGVIDRIDVAADGAVRVVDYKTGRAPGIGFEAEAMLQLRFYALVLWRSRGVVPAMLRLIYLGSGETISHCPDEDELRATERVLDALGQAVRAAHRTGTWPANRGRACTFCSHQDLCPAYGNTPPPLPVQVQVPADVAGAEGPPAPGPASG